MKNKTITVLAVGVLLLASCGFPVRFTTVRGTGNVVTEPRRVAGFNMVEMNGIGTLIIEQGESEALEITAEENLLPYLESRVSGRNLILGVEEFVNIQPTEEIIYRLEIKDLDLIETSGLGKVKMDDFKTDQLTIEISGSGNILIRELSADQINLEISGLGDIEITGAVDEQSVEISGAGSYDAPDLKSRSASVQISGSGSARVWVLEELDVEISGMGTVEYYGSPVIDSEISGAGKLVSSGEK